MHNMKPTLQQTQQFGLDEENTLRLYQLLNGVLDPDDCEEAQCYKDFFHNPSYCEKVLYVANEMIGGYGTEILFEDDNSDNEVCEYINTGDLYNLTIIMDSADFIVCDMGTYRESLEHQKTEAMAA